MKKVMASALVIMAMLLGAMPQAWAEGNNEVSLSSKSEYELSEMLDENIANGNNELVKKILAALNFDEGHMTFALFTASEHGNIEIINYLLDKGADPEFSAHVTMYQRPIDRAKNKETELTFIMHYTDKKKRLQEAAQYGHMDIAKNLMEQAETFLDKSEAVQLAVQYEFFDILEKLNPSADEVNRKDKDANTAMHYAAASGNAECVKYLISKGGEVNIRNNKGETPLMKAANIDVMKVLLDNNANINVRDSNGNTLIHNTNNHDMFLELIKHNIDINVKNDHGETPLHTIENTDTLLELIKRGADINARNDRGETPLISAIDSTYSYISRTNVEKVKLLLEQGANVNDKTENGDTALHIACRKCLPDVVKLLIQYGADVEAKDSQGYAPIHYPAFALDAGGVSVEPKDNRDEIIGTLKILVENKANINAKTKDGETPLLTLFNEDFMLLYYLYKFDIFEALISLGADVNAQDKKGNTVLHTIMEYVANDPSSIYDYDDEIKLLLEHGANPAIKNKAGNTVIDIIEKKFNFKEKEEIKRSDIYWEMKDRMHAPITKPKAKEPLAKSATVKQDGKESSEKVKAAQQKAKEQNKKVDITRKEAEESVKKAKAAQQEAKESLKKLREQNQKFKESLKKTKESAKKRNEVEQELQQLEELFKATDALS